ncbi:MAG: nucleotidyltransferase domain-containing protein, partial [Candidatus Bathyarchaeia archaeon]
MNPLNETIKEKILNECFNIAENRKVIASCIYGSRICGYAREDSDYDVLLIIEDYPDSLRYHTRKLNGIFASILAIDKDIFEIDVKKGGLGEFISGRLLTPYLPIFNENFLQAMEKENKKRVIKEEIEDLIIEFGESTRGLIIEPKYFILSRMRKRAKVYPPIKYSYLNLLREDIKEKNLERIMDGFLK